MGAAEPLPLPDKPSIALLPFQNMSGDPEQEYFVDGMVEEIITALSPDPVALRPRPQFEFYVQGPSGRREAGRPRTGRALQIPPKQLVELGTQVSFKPVNAKPP
jgi:hypothetical protein